MKITVVDAASHPLRLEAMHVRRSMDPKKFVQVMLNNECGERSMPDSSISCWSVSSSGRDPYVSRIWQNSSLVDRIRRCGNSSTVTIVLCVGMMLDESLALEVQRMTSNPFRNPVHTSRDEIVPLGHARTSHHAVPLHDLWGCEIASSLNTAEALRGSSTHEAPFGDINKPGLAT